MSRNWIRSWDLQVGDGGSSVDLSKMRIRFLMRHWTTQSTNPGEFRIYNLSDRSAQQIGGKNMEHKKVRFQAGYEGNVGTIYQGEILQPRIGRESPTETFVDLYCRDGDQAYNWGVVNKTFKPGSTQQDHVDEVLRVMKQFGVKKGRIEGLSKKKYPRSVTLYGMARDIMRTIAMSNESTWHILSGELNHIPNGAEGKGGGGAFVLNANTGLIGMPQETLQGIIVTALINPRFKIESQLVINEKSIQRAAWGTNYDAEVTGGQLETLGTADGTYTIKAIEWRGDTHGPEWYATMVCIGSKTGALPSGQTGLAYPYTGN